MEVMKKAKPQDIVYHYVKNQIVGKSMFPGNRIIEDDIIRVFQLLEASSIVFNVGSVSAPAVLNLPTGDLLTCNVQISTLTEWS